MTTESTPRPTPEGKYNPRLFLLMATNPDHFRRQMPHIVTDIAGMSDSLVSIPLLNQMREGMQKVLSEGPAAVLDVVYGDYARKQRWIVGKKLFADSESIHIPTPMQDLTVEQRKMWDTYLYTGELPRDIALDAFSLAISLHFSQLPSTRYSFDSSIVEIDTRLRKVPFQLAHNWFPDLTDDEARELFGNRTAEDVRVLAEEANGSSL